MREDFELDRIYLPLEERDRFGVSEAEIAQGDATPGFRSLLALQVERAREPVPRGRARAGGGGAAGAARNADGARACTCGCSTGSRAWATTCSGGAPALPPWQLGAAALRALREPS